MFDTSVVAKLEGIVGKDNMLTKNVETVDASTGASVVRPHLVVMPNNNEQVCQIASLAHEYGISVYPTSSGPHGNGKSSILLSLSHLGFHYSGKQGNL